MACRYGTELFISLLPGDGVAFYGVLHDKEILSLLAGLVKYNHITTKLAEEVAELIKDSETKLILERNGFGYRYSHANTIRVLLENYPEDIGYEDRFMTFWIVSREH